MPHAHDEKPHRPGIFFYRGTLAPLLAVLMMAPLLFFLLSFAAVLATGGTLGALIFPLLLRRGVRGQDAARDIELGRDQYRRVEPDAPKLPRQ